MSKDSIPTFVITSHTESGFMNFIYSSSQFFPLSNLIVLHDAKVFRMIFNSLNIGAEFRLLIHPKMVQGSDNSVGVRFQNSLKEHELKNIPFITRSTEIRAKCNEKDINFIEKDGYTYFDATRVDMDHFIEDIPIFKKEQQMLAEEIKVVKPAQNKDSYDFTILTALPKEEFGVFKKYLDGGIKNGFFVGKFKNLEELHYSKDVTLVSQKKMGMIDASVKISEIISDINSEMIILSGVCGGRKEKKVKLYDIIIPEQIIDIITGKYENKKFIPYNYTEKVNEELIKYLKETVITEDFIKNEMYSLVPNDPKYKRENEIIQNIEIHHDTMACGPFVLKTNDFLEKKSKEINDKIVGFEMESYGVIRALELSKSNKYGLIVKSVMDYTDESKKDVAENGEEIKTMAAYMSYICTRALLPHLKSFLIKNRK